MLNVLANLSVQYIYLFCSYCLFHHPGEVAEKMSNLSNLASQTAETIMQPECVNAKIFICLQVKTSVDLNLTKFDKIKRNLWQI